MNENLKRYYRKEEEFIKLFPSVVKAVKKIIGEEWVPESDCDDEIRRKRDYLIVSGELHSLVFDGAAVYEDQNKFSSAQVTLKSTKRIVTIRVVKNNNDFEAKIIVDRNQL